MAAVAGRLIQRLPKGSSSYRASCMHHPTDASFWHLSPWRLSSTKAGLSLILKPSACSFHAQQSDPGKSGPNSTFGVAAKRTSKQTSDAPAVSVTKPSRKKKSPTKKALVELCRENWLAALNSPKDLSSSLVMPTSLANSNDLLQGNSIEEEEVAAELATLGGAITSLNDLPVASGTSYVLGIDPDVSGALAVIRTQDLSSVEVFDVPSVQVMIGTKKRKRHDARSITALINDINAPHGSIAYIEQSFPFPKDGKQGWWASGFGFGMWIGVLVASGFSVVPVPSSVWKRAMGLFGKSTTKDDSRMAASLLFPLLSSQLQRKKDHGRAEALLIAAFGKGIPAPLQQTADDGIT